MPTVEEHTKLLSSMFNVQYAANPELNDETCHSLSLVKNSIEKCQDFCQLVNISSDTSQNRAAWLSYRFFGTVVQSDIFTITQAVQGVGNFVHTMKNSF